MASFLEWGPIIWGLIGLSVGIIVGGILDMLIRQRNSGQKVKLASKGKPAEVVLLVKCSKEQANTVEEVLVDHFALGTARFENNTDVKQN